MKKTLPFWLRKLHAWLSMIIALPLVLVIVTGLLLQVKKQWTWVQPPTQKSPATQPSLSFSEILKVARGVPEADIKSWGDIDRLDARPSKSVIKIRAKNHWEIQIHHQSGEVLQVAYRRSDIIESLHDGSFFHEFVKLGLFLPVALALIIVWFTGLYLLFLPILRRRRLGKNKSGQKALE
ncbi:MAG: PepSY-associated TM helix domain-containing protein [Planctomycetota bacterium]|nr:PepSY-associated TM helix domain-containing protein [Planctomycetota bacterium]